VNITPSDRYLEESPWEAFIMMVNDQYHFQLFPETTTLVGIESLANNRVEVTIASQRSRSLRNLLPSLEQFTFVLTLIDLSTYFGGALSIPASELTTPSTMTIVNWLQTNINAIPFYKDDIIHEEIDLPLPVTYVLNAHPRSLRWSGSVTITLT
jgi:hypothetical protein